MTDKSNALREENNRTDRQRLRKAGKTSVKFWSESGGYSVSWKRCELSYRLKSILVTNYFCPDVPHLATKQRTHMSSISGTWENTAIVAVVREKTFRRDERLRNFHGMGPCEIYD
jgi:hypothetical protein